jgi:nitroimidazol reductase NimA-like FMN-containing flavoprotein (pyridoxamine 5'-phosphate oxidase superfamily)
MMRKHNQEITDHSTLEEILAGAQICRLAMMDVDRPYLLPFNYGYRDRTIYIHAAPEGKKIELLRRNPYVSFEVEDGVKVIPGSKACSWATRYRSVVGKGKAEIITDPDRKKLGLEAIMVQHGASEFTDFEEKHLERMVILKISITSMTGKRSSNWDRSNPEP